jgi:hypothetical protein
MLIDLYSYMHTNVFNFDVISYICTELLIKMLQLPKLLVIHQEPLRWVRLTCAQGHIYIFYTRAHVKVPRSISNDDTMLGIIHY